MNLYFNIEISNQYKSHSQKARVMSEEWVIREIHCPNCGGILGGFGNNKPVADCQCSHCIQDIEVKSKMGAFRDKVTSGSYAKMISRINSPQCPLFFFLNYSREYKVDTFFVVPKHIIVPELIQQRKPLSITARRAGWIGSNILISQIPENEKIFYVKDGVEIDKKIVLESWIKKRKN